ncbi:MAG: hypothetical protein P4L86_21610 [Mycobacterium sp.]|nr:hypothetical protein [Mycobacterium sp.]
MAITKSWCLISALLTLTACTPKPPPYESRGTLPPGSTSQSAMPGHATADSSPDEASFVDEFGRPDTTSGLGDGWDLRGMPQNGAPLLPATDGYIKDGHFTYAGKGDAIAVRQFRAPLRSIGTEGQFRRINPARPDTTMMIGTGGDNELDTDVVVFLANRISWELRSRLVKGTLKTVASGNFSHPLELDHVYKFVLSCTGDHVSVVGPGLTISKPLSRPISPGAYGFWRESPNRIPAGEVFDFDKVWALEDGQPMTSTTASTTGPGN